MLEEVHEVVVLVLASARVRRLELLLVAAYGARQPSDCRLGVESTGQQATDLCLRCLQLGNLQLVTLDDLLEEM